MKNEIGGWLRWYVWFMKKWSALRALWVGMHDQGTTFTLTLILGSHYMSRKQNRGRWKQWVIWALIMGTIWFCTEINRFSLEIPTIFYKLIINPGLSTFFFLENPSLCNISISRQRLFQYNHITCCSEQLLHYFMNL